MRKVAALAAMALISCDAGKPPQKAAQPNCAVDWPVFHELENELNFTNVVTVQRSNAVTWNGTRVNRKHLEEYLSLLPTMDPEPLTLLRFEKSSTCKERSDVIKIMKSSKHCASRCMFDGMTNDSEVEPANPEL